MIYTVTLNPSLDYIVTVKDFEIGKTNRTLTESMKPGGKGLNVSMVLQNLGICSTALGFTAGFTGVEIEKMAAERGLNCDFIRTQQGLSRINIKMKDFDGTEINGQGPMIREVDVERLLEKLDGLGEGDILILAGSLPVGLEKSFYRDVLKRMSGKGVLCVVDTTGEQLLNVLENHPFLIKPNHHELGELFGVEIRSREEVVAYAKKLQEMGARNVLVSLSGEGAVLAAEDGQVYMQEAPKGTLVNAVGAGDSMVAGVLAGLLESDWDYLQAFRMALAAGSGTAFSEDFATAEEIRALYKSTFPKEKVECGIKERGRK